MKRNRMAKAAVDQLYDSCQPSRHDLIADDRLKADCYDARDRPLV